MSKRRKRHLTDEHKKNISESVKKSAKFRLAVEKMSQAKKEWWANHPEARIFSKERRAKMSKFQKERYAKYGPMGWTMKGRKVSAETRAKMSAVRKGVPKSAETRRRMSEAHKKSERSRLAILEKARKRTERTFLKKALARIKANNTEE